VQERTRELEAQKAIAEDANRMKTELLEIATHDLKNPLLVVTAYSEMLARLSEVPRDVREKSRTIFQASQRMFGLVDALLTTAALEGQVTLKKQDVDIGELARAVVDDTRPLAERKEQTVAIRFEPACVAHGDLDRLRDVMDNLVTNAIKYSPPGKPVNVSVRKENGSVRVEVRDEGPGLTPEDLTRLFQRFGRAKVQTTGGEPSTGLGLSIVKRIVELHGGRVWAESPGRQMGSTFVIELPAKLESA
jgi:signal transduction histidine kinase